VSHSPRVSGIAPKVDTSPLLLYGRIGLEGEARLLLWHGPATLIENSYLGGPRMRIFHYRDLFFNGKFLRGQGHLDVPDHLLGGGNYFAYAPGFAIDDQVAKYISVCVEYEYQRWPTFKCFKCGDGGIGGLTPNGFSCGISYAIHSSRSDSAAKW
jgi:hypothetical protein